LKDYCGYSAEFTSFVVTEFGIFAHEYATYLPTPLHILHGFFWGDGIVYAQAVVCKVEGENLVPLQGLYGIEWVNCIVRN